MIIHVKRILPVLLTCLLVKVVNAQVAVSQEISPKQINKDEYATLKIIIQNANDIQGITAPSFKDFIVLSGPNQETGMSSVNGHVTQYAALSFILKARHPGKINIGPSSVKISGKDYKTNATELLVKNAVASPGSAGSNAGSISPFGTIDPFENARPSNDFNDYILKKGENVADKVNRNMQLKLETNRTSCYVGEPVVAAYKLYTRLKSDSKLSQNPSFNGFSVIDLTRPDYTAYTKGKLNGREYNVYTIRKAQLYPLQPGNIELEVAELENNVQFIKDEYVSKRSNDVFGVFDDFAGAAVPPEGIVNQAVTLKSQPVTILVKPLPETNKPASFNGAVGDFSIDAHLEKNSFPANEAGKLVVRISGKGNLQLLTAPVLQWPAGIDPFDPKVSDDLDKTVVPVEGTKTIEYNFSVNKEGEYSLPAITFSFFDPVSATYKTISTKDIPFTVTKATGPAVTDTAGTRIEKVSGINRIFSNRWWIIEFLAVVFVVGIIIWIWKENKTKGKQETVAETVKEEEQKFEAIIETAAINQQNPLTRSEECLNTDNCNDFYSLLNSELKTYLSQKFQVAIIDVNTRSIASVMDSKGIQNGVILQLQQLLQEIEWQLYTPFERNERMRELYGRSQELVQLINSYDIRHL